MKGQSGLEKWEILKFSLFHIVGCHRQTWRQWRLIFGIRDPLDGTFHWCKGHFPHSKKILWFCFKGVPEVQGCPKNTCLTFFLKHFLCLWCANMHLGEIWCYHFCFGPLTKNVKIGTIDNENFWKKIIFFGQVFSGQPWTSGTPLKQNHNTFFEW